jgi:hypothetical protein
MISVNNRDKILFFTGKDKGNVYTHMNIGQYQLQITFENNDIRLFNPYTMHFCSVYTTSQQMHCSYSLLTAFYSCYMFRRMYVIIREPSVECPAELH